MSGLSKVNQKPVDFGFGIGKSETRLSRIFIITCYAVSLAAGVAVSLVPFLIG